MAYDNFPVAGYCENDKQLPQKASWLLTVSSSERRCTTEVEYPLTFNPLALELDN